MHEYCQFMVIHEFVDKIHSVLIHLYFELCKIFNALIQVCPVVNEWHSNFYV